jgi:hypothetical protein
MSPLARAATAALLAALALAGCGAAADQDQARGAAERLYAAVRAGDGEAACRELSDPAREELESTGETACPEAIVELSLQGERAGEVEVFSNEAAVHLADGDTVDGWKVSALGCTGQTPSTPAECEVQA